MLRCWGVELGAGLGVGASGGGPGADATALMDADFATGRFRIGGTCLADETGFRSAIGGSLAPSGHLVIGPHVPNDAQELITDGGFLDGVGDWQTNGDSLAVVGGELKVTGIGGNTTSAFLGINSVIAPSGQAYRLRARVRRGTAGSVNLGFGSPFGTQNYAGTPSISSTSMVPVEMFCGGFHTSNAAIAVRHNGNPSNGTFFADDISLKPVLPLQGFVAGELCGVIEATAPAAGGVERVLFQADDNAEYNNAPVERNFVRLVWGADGHLRFIVSFGGTGSQVEQANLDLGIVSAGMAFAVAFSARANDFRAALLGQPIQSDTSGSLPGLATLRFGKGRSNADRLWTGSIDRVRLYPRATTGNEFLAMAAGEGIVAWGDSLTNGAGASDASIHAYPVVGQALFDPPRAVLRQGVGGQTSTQVAARMNAIPILVSVEGDVLPASGGVAVTHKSINVLGNAASFFGSQIGWLCGVKGTMTTDAEGSWTFTRLVAGASVPVTPGSQFVCELGEVLRPRVNWLWMGRNGAQAGHDVAGDIAAAVASLRHQRFLVGAVLVPTTPGDSHTLNAQLAATYGPRFVNVLQALIDLHNGSPGDLADVAAGYVPASLRSDAVHLNDAGYAVVASAFHAATIAMGW